MDHAKVLVIDDERKIRQMYRRLLTAEGFQVLEAANGEEATLTLLQDKSIDLFLLDIDMPVIDGAAFFDTVKLYNRAAKVIVASVYPLESQKRLIDSADDYYDKAEGTNLLLSKVKKVLKGG